MLFEIWSPWGLYVKDIREISLKRGVDPVLIQAGVGIESAFNASAASRKGAGGLLQLSEAEDMEARVYGALSRA